MHGWTKTLYKFDDGYCDFNAVDYLCSTNDKGGLPGVAAGPECQTPRLKEADGSNSRCRLPVENHVETSSPYPEGAESGKYIIKYHVQDWAGNSECSTPARTVIVKDTLAPRLYLHYGGNLLTKTSLTGLNTDGIGINGEQNFNNLTHLQQRRGEQGLYKNAQGRTVGYTGLNSTSGGIVESLVSSFNTPINHVPQRRLIAGSSQTSASVWMVSSILGTAGGLFCIYLFVRAERRQQFRIETVDL